MASYPTSKLTTVWQDIPNTNNAGGYVPGGWANNMPATVNADLIMVNGVPLTMILTNIQQRLWILEPVIHLHAEHEELRAIYLAYNAKLNEIQEKIKMWEQLKK